MNEDAFIETCLRSGRIQPLPTATEREHYARDARTLSMREVLGAQLLLGSEAEELVVGHAYKAMEFKANELLALKGFRSKSHVCSQAALSKLLDRPDLARRLSQAYEDRQAYDYTSNPASMRAADSLEGFLENAEAYIEDVAAAIAGASP